eukprot:3747616-Pyramimonas_sp.AAC.1
MPVGAHGKRSEVDIPEIDGGMPTLIAKREHVDYQASGVYGVDPCAGPGWHLLIEPLGGDRPSRSSRSPRAARRC